MKSKEVSLFLRFALCATSLFAWGGVNASLLHSPDRPEQVWVAGYSPYCSRMQIIGENGDDWRVLPPQAIDFMNTNCSSATYELLKCEVREDTYGNDGIVDCEYLRTDKASGTQIESGFTIRKDCRPASSPFEFFADTEKCSCKDREHKFVYPRDGNQCIERKDVHRHDQSCRPKVGNPIHALKGTKEQSEQLASGPIQASVNYDTRRAVPANDPSAVIGFPLHSFGAFWKSSLHKRLLIQGGTMGSIQAGRGGDVWSTFTYRNDLRRHSPVMGGDDRIASISGGWLFTASDGKSQEIYNDAGVLLTTAFAGGGQWTHSYSVPSTPVDIAPVAGLLLSVTDQFGHSLQFTYEQPEDNRLSPRIRTMTDSAGGLTQFRYNAHGELDLITWPDGMSRAFLYEKENLPWALTGIVDEELGRHSTYDYDLEGRATLTKLGQAANEYSLEWLNKPSQSITDTYLPDENIILREHRWTTPSGISVRGPMGQIITMTAEEVAGAPRLTSRSQPGGSGCNDSSSEMAYDSRGNVTSEIDFGRHRTCRVFDGARDVETVRVEGLSDSAADAEICRSNLAEYQVAADKPQRKITTEWHRLWKLQTRRAEPKRITTTVYNGEKDPLNNNQELTCIVDGDPRLPDGSRIAVVCARYEESTQDETGSQGFNAPRLEKRKWSYTYNQYGQLKSETDPRGKLTSYEYWPAPTSFAGDRGHWQGDLMKVTNALGQVTEHLEYNKRGQVLTTKYPNGSRELREYHPRGWLAKVTLVPAGGGVGQVTQYDYYDTGLLKKATQPDGSWAFYTWDAAHRLKKVKDSADNSVEYVLDNMGNREEEVYKDPQGTLVKTITRTFDALGRMDSSKGLQ